MHFAVAAVAEEEKAYFPRRSFAVVDTATKTMVVVYYNQSHNCNYTLEVGLEVRSVS